MKILFTGGGTMGPVAPLIAVMRQMKMLRPSLQCAWAGTENGPERRVVEAEGVPFFSVPVAKFPRYPSLAWLRWPVDFLKAKQTAERILDEIAPSLVVSAGGFTGVPVIRAAAQREIPCAIHQLDAEPGLANRSVARRCRSVTTSFAYDRPPFSGINSVQVATPSRFAGKELPSAQEARMFFGLNPDRPTVLITGGGTGAIALNAAVRDLLPMLLKDAQVIHLTGASKLAGAMSFAGYVVKEFLDEKEMTMALAAADLVVSRAGMGAIADLATTSKPTIFIPIPKSHQEKNVERLSCEVVQQTQYFSQQLSYRMSELLGNAKRRAGAGSALHASLPTDDGRALAEKWLTILK